MKDSFDLHSWYLKQYSLYETDDPKIGAEEEGDPNKFVVGEVDSLKYSISEYITENKNVNTELRKIKSSSPIEVTQIDENSSSAKPKKKGWWSQ